MKKKLHLQKSLFALLLALFVGMGTAYAADFSKVYQGQTFYFNITDATNHYVEITYPGTLDNGEPWEGYTKPTGNITLPSTITYNGVTYTVKAIGECAFIGCSGLTGSLTIPSSVTLIDQMAFADCSGFTGSLTIPNSVTTIVWKAFDDCSGFTGSLTIPNSVTTIDHYAFRNCSGFTGSLTIGNSVTSIGDYAFFYCSGFTGSLTIGNSVTSIGDYTFFYCSGFTGSLTIGNSVTSIGELAFYGCSGFTGSLTIPNTLTTISDYAFCSCSGFTGSLTIGNSVTSIGENAFSGCSGFTGSLIIPNSVTSIGFAAFSGCSGFTGSLTIGNSVTAIGDFAFHDCEGFTGSLTIGSSVFMIGQEAFENCTGLTSIKVYPELTPSLGSNVFNNVPTTIPVYVPCQSLEDYQSASGWSSFTNIQCYDPLTYSINDDGVSVTVTGHVDGTAATGPILIPETKTINGVTYTVTAIGDYAFDHCGGLTGSLTIPNTVTTIGEDAFNWCTGFNGTLTLGNSLTTIGEYAFYACTGFTGSLTIPNSVTTIDRYVFYYCTGFTGTLTLGSSLTSLGNGAFYACSGFTGTLTLPSSLTTISGSAFVSCSGFTGALVIPDGVTTIGNSAFSGCSGLTSLILPASVTSLGNYAFGYCEGLTTMTVFPATPPTLGNYVFRDVPTTIPVYVPCGSLEDYQSASGWNAFTNMRCLETMTVYDGTSTNNRIPAYIYFFDDFARSQFVIPAADLAEMTGRSISSMTFYTTTQNVPYTTVSDADVYLMEVDYTTISTYEPKASATVVYNGRFSIVNAGSGGEMTIHFSTPYVYQGGNLLVGIDNTEDNGFKNIYFKGQTVSGASISGSNGSSTGTIPATQQDFIPKTSFVYAPSKTLPYTYGFEEEDEFDCWTMLDCDENTGITAGVHYEGSHCFQFWYTTNPPQYLISPELECTTDVGVSFRYRNEGSEWPETFQVGYSTTTKSPDAFTWGDELTAENSTWTQYENTFPAGTRYVAIKHLSYDQNVLFLDKFRFMPSLCPPEDQCELTFTLSDSYGDGWNGAAINVVDAVTNILLASMSAQNHGGVNTPSTDILSLDVCDGRELRFEWVSGSYDSECSYVVTDVNGDEIFSGSGAMSEPVTYMVDCPETFIFLTDGNWNDGSHWNTGTVPPAGSDVIIQANVTVPAGYLAVANAVSLDGGSITVADGGQLKHNTLDLMVTMKKNIAGYDDANSQNNYYLLAVPFLSVQVPTAMTANPGSDFYRFDPSESGVEWRNHKQEPITFVQRRYGYLYANPESVELSLTGITLSVSNEFTMNYTVDYTEGSSNPSNGWALLGNPFTYNAYVYRFDSNNEFVPMPIMMYDEEGELQTIYGGPVAPMQGFFVHVTETTTVYFSGTGHDYVDLGLPSGLLWATCNVGADNPEDYGDYYAWGETTTKSDYSWSTYQYCMGSETTMTKYCTNADYGNNGFVDNQTTLFPEDDAATANWGSGWRMPTKEEWQELYNNTTVTWTTQNGVNGRLFTASNGNSLFLPAAGYRIYIGLGYAGSSGYYWSSSLDTDGPSDAWRLYFNSGTYGVSSGTRGYGYTVRPVRSARQN